MVNQLIVLIIISAVLTAGTSLRHFAMAGDGCEDCNCGSDDCCGEEKTEK